MVPPMTFATQLPIFGDGTWNQTPADRKCGCARRTECQHFPAALRFNAPYPIVKLSPSHCRHCYDIMGKQRHLMAGRSSQPSEFHLFSSPTPPAPSARPALFFRSEQFMADQANRDTRQDQLGRGGRPRPPMHRRMRPTDGNGGNGEVKIDRELLAELDREEPLSLAEELDKAAERVR